MSFQSMTIASLLVAVLFSSGVFAKDEVHDQECEMYTNANSTSATCNEVSGMVCTGGCTGYVTATKCTTSQGMNDPKPPLTNEKCTISYGKSSATTAVCITEKQVFTCYGPVTGKANCKSCKRQITSPDTPPAKGTTPGSGNGNNGNGSNGNGSSGNGSGKGGSSASGTKPTPEGSPKPADDNSAPATNTPTGSGSGSTTGTTTQGTSPAGNTTTTSPGTPPATGDAPAAGSPDSSKTDGHSTSSGSILALNGVSLALATLLSSALM
ncbi:hypothetical protein PGT21_025096 [Puccinia graminis f. sp. tritici]|uniref:Secreted protein n=1 Tax=Puccinia graminis f. sp. tritici TaxID=56615 RepID=A0A5B0S1S0_PUCGR|nr:hypothetical protein PGT21_025096 [Puccinia graminis f. sp. tritici]KAA1131732.1 hypothetical protein PGTUg99_018223 [Puccinia graminis f. sp. tritici]